MTQRNNTFYLLELDNALALNFCKSYSDYNSIVFSLMGITKEWQQKALNISFPFIKFLLVLGSFVFVTIKFIVAFLKALFSKTSEPVSGRDYFLLFLPLFYSRCKAAGVYENSEYWVIGPNIKDIKPYNLQGKTIIDYRLFLQPAQCCKALWKCYCTITKYCCNVHCFYPLYKTWDYYSAYEAINNMVEGCNIYYSNQSDRWAILFDRIKSNKQILIQHGAASKKVICPVRLLNVDILYAISKSTWKDMFNSILDCKPEVRYMKPTIKLSEIELTERTSILVVSHITYFEHEKKLIEWLYNNGYYNIYLKKHPEVKNDTCYKELEKKYGFHYITDASFPNVDAVISYLSTLAYEYMTLDIPVFIYEPSNGLNYDELFEFMNHIDK